MIEMVRMTAEQSSANLGWASAPLRRALAGPRERHPAALSAGLRPPSTPADDHPNHPPIIRLAFQPYLLGRLRKKCREVGNS